MFKIIKIASDTKNSGLRNIYTHKSSIKNSLCGDKIKIELIVDKAKIKSIRYETEACILCEASACLVAKKFINYSLKNLLKDINKLKEKIKNKKTILPLKFTEFKYLLDKNALNRVNCVTLPFNALLKAFKYRL